MAKSKSQQPSADELWVTLKQAAWLIEMREGSYKHSEYYRMLSQSDKRTVGRSILLNARSVVKCYADKKVDRVTRPIVAEDGTETVGGKWSAALERQRDEQAKILQIKRLELEKQLVSRADIRGGLERLAGIIRKSGEILGRDFGPGAQSVLEDALISFGREMERESATSNK
jgi:hypothetical protein